MKKLLVLLATLCLLFTALFALSACGDDSDGNGDETPHEHSYASKVTEPNCTERGYTTYTCSCGNSYISDYVDALGHTEETIEAVAPTCTETGLTAGKKCSVCDAVLVEQSVVNALGHIEETIEAVAPTCTETGLTAGKKCSVCDAVLVEQSVVNALGHAEETIEAVAPTCTETGLTAGKKCSVCDAVIEAQVEVPATGHTYGSAVTEPTCTERGYTTYTCHCGDAYVADYVDALGHTEETIEAVAPTCTETGLTAGKKCSVCDAVIEAQVEVPATGHTYGSAVTEPTCTEQGYTTYTCSCGNSYISDYVDALGHTEVTIEAVAPTCTETGLTAGKKCSVCDAVLVEQSVVNALGHAEETIEAVAPTCTETGLTAGKKCSVCDAVLVEQSVVNALGHTFYYGECIDCGAEDPDFVPTKYNLTFLVDGEEYYVFSTAGKELVEMPEEPTKAGYSFVGWYMDAGIAQIPFDNKMFLNAYINCDFEAYALFEIIEYTATFKVGDDIIDEVKFTVNSEGIAEPKVPEKVGYIGEWESYTLSTSDLTVNAVYSAIEYKVSFVYRGEVIGEVAYTVESVSIEEPAVPERVGYNGKWTEYTLGTSDITVYATYTAIIYTATFVDGEDIVATKEFTVESESIDEPAAPTKRGYDVCWAEYSIVANNITIEAVYTLKEYQIVFENTKGVANSNPTKYTVESETIVLSALYAEGYSFKGWLLDGNPIVEIPGGSIGDIALYATWVEYSLGDITYNKDKTAIKVTDELTAELFGAECVDTDGNKIDVTVSASAASIAGTKITVRLTARKGNYVKTVTLTDIKVYGAPTIVYNGTDVKTVNLKDGFAAEHFGVAAYDSFGEELEVLVDDMQVILYNGTTGGGVMVFPHTGNNSTTIVYRNEHNIEIRGGDAVYIIFKATDALGNSLTLRTNKISVYDAPIIDFEAIPGIKLDDLVNESFDLSRFNATAKDSFGKEVEVNTTISMPTFSDFGYSYYGTSLWYKLAGGYTESSYYGDMRNPSYQTLEFVALNRESYSVFFKCDSTMKTNIRITCKETGELLFMNSSSQSASSSANYYNTGSFINIFTLNPTPGYTYIVEAHALNGAYAGYVGIQVETKPADIDYSICAGKSVTVNFTATDDYGNTATRTEQIYIYGTPVYAERNGNHTLRIEEGLSSLDVYIYDSCGNEVKNLKYSLSGGKLEAGNTIWVDVIAEDVAGNVLELTIIADVYAMPELKVTPDRLWCTIYPTGSRSNTPEFKATDSFGNSPQMYWETPIADSGNTSKWVLEIVDNAMHRLVYEFDCYFYSADDIVFTYGDLPNVNVSLYGGGKEFGAVAKDSFGEDCEIYLVNSVGNKITAGGYKGNVKLVARDIAGNTVESTVTYSDVKVYGMPVVQLASYVTPYTSADFAAIVKDSFGVEIYAQISYESELINNEMVKVRIVATDAAGNTLDDIFEVKVFADAADYEMEENETGYTLLKYKGNASALTIPSIFTKIAANAFLDNSTITELIINSNVTEIEFGALTGMTKISSITLPFIGDKEVSPSFTHLGGIFGTKTYDAKVHDLPATLKSVIFNGKALPKSAFHGAQTLTDIFLGENVETIGNNAFYNCVGIKTITIPDSVTYIGDSAFHGCTELVSVYINDLSKWCNITFEYYRGASNPLFYASSFYVNGELITILDIPEDVTQIKDNAFMGYEKLTRVNLHENVVSIGNNAFMNCKNLGRIDIPASVIRIGEKAFNGCSSLTAYCEVASKPAGWKSNWIDSKNTVVWGS